MATKLFFKSKMLTGVWKHPKKNISLNKNYSKVSR